jgi:hypothetical protein
VRNSRIAVPIARIASPSADLEATIELCSGVTCRSVRFEDADFYHSETFDAPASALETLGKTRNHAPEGVWSHVQLHQT